MTKIRNLFKYLRQFSDYMVRRRIATIAASSAFWFFLSLVPIVILLSSILPYTAITQEEVMTVLAPVIPYSMTTLLATILQDVYSSSLAVVSVSILAAVWSSAQGFAALIRGLEDMLSQPGRSGYLRRRTKGILYTLGFLAALLLSIVVMGLGNSLLRLADTAWPGVHPLISFLLDMRFVPATLVLTIFFAALYKFGPGMPVRLGDQLPGALLAAIGWCVFSGVFSQLVVFTGGYGTYGSLATVVAVMLWLYYCMYILLLGASLNKALPRLRNENQLRT